MAIQVEIDGVLTEVTKDQLFELAAQNKIMPETLITVNGKSTFAGNAKGIVFGQPEARDKIPTPPEIKSENEFAALIGEPDPPSAAMQAAPPAGSIAPPGAAVEFPGVVPEHDAFALASDTFPLAGEADGQIPPPLPPETYGTYGGSAATSAQESRKARGNFGKNQPVGVGGFFLDPGFNTFFTPLLISVLWRLVVLVHYLAFVSMTLAVFVIGLRDAGMSIEAFGEWMGTAMGFVMAFLVPFFTWFLMSLFLAASLMLTRISFEGIAAFYRMAEHLKNIDAQTSNRRE